MGLSFYDHLVQRYLGAMFFFRAGQKSQKTTRPWPLESGRYGFVPLKVFVDSSSRRPYCYTCVAPMPKNQGCRALPAKHTLDVGVV